MEARAQPDTLPGESFADARHMAARKALTKPSRPTYRASYGNSGTRLSGGRVLGHESNPDLMDVRTRINAFAEMRRVDPKVRTSWQVRKQTMLSGERAVEATGGSPLHRACADLCAEVLGLRGGDGVTWAPLASEPFESILARQVEAEFDGFRYQEVVWDLVWSHALGRMVTAPCKIADREPSAHKAWRTDPHDRTCLLAVEQHHTSGNEPPLPIPASKLLLTTFDQRGANFDGLGLARNAWWWSKAKQAVSDAMLIAIDRWAVPVPKIRTDYELAAAQGIDPGDQLDDMVDNAYQQAEAFRALEQAALRDNPAVSFETFGEGVLNVDNPIKAIELCDRQIAAVFLAQHLELGVTDSGSRNVGEVHESIFRRSIINALQAVAESFERLFRDVCRYNFGAAAEAYAPKLRFSGLNVGPLAELLPMLPQLLQIPGLFSDEDRAQIRAKLLDLLSIAKGGR